MNDDPSNLCDAVIVGAGAAGLSAALVLGRARRRVIVCDDGQQRNNVALEMHGTLSRDGMPPAEFLAISRAELDRYPSVRILTSRVATINPDAGGFLIELANGDTHETRRVLLATGAKDILPDIDGLTTFWGRSIFVCPYCDGWEVRDQPLVVDGPPEAVIEFAQELYQWSHDLVICGIPNDPPREHRAWLDATKVATTTSNVRSVMGTDGKLNHVVLENGKRIECGALFLSVSLRQHSTLAKDLGCAFTAEDRIEVGDDNRTSVPGCYAAGDATTKLHQVIIAAASGARAAIAINNDLLQEDIQLRIRG